MKKRKIVCLVASFILAFNVVFSDIQPVRAVPFDLANGITTSEMVQGINNELKSINKVKIRETNTENGLLYNVKTLTKHACWIHALQELQKEEGNKDEKILGYSQETINYQQEKILEQFSKFNKFYSQDSEKFIKCEIMDTGVEANEFDYNEVMQDTKEYLTIIMDKMLEESNNDVEAASKKNKKALKYIYYICEMDNTVTMRFNSMMPENSDDDGKGTPIFTLKQNGNAKGLRDLTTSDKYKDLITKGREISDKDRANITSGDIDASKELIELFLKGLQLDDGKANYADVSKLWYLYFSGSSVYQPFNSKVGCDEIKTAINQISKTKGDNNTVIKTFNNAIKYRKPLYSVQIDSDGIPTGTATMITLKQLMEKVNNQDTCGLIVPKGLWDKAMDDNSYVYYKENPLINKVENKEKKEDGEQSSDDEKSSDDKTVKDSKSLEFYGSASNDITDKDAMSKPIVTIGKVNGGYTMNTFVLSNIFQSVANIDDFHPDKTLLYLDVFGDIVLEDGTVVLPGAANSSFIKKDKCYYPYTVAFLGTYPGLSTSKTFTATCPNPEGKFIFRTTSLDSDENVDTSKEVNEVDGQYFDKENTHKITAQALDTEQSVKIMSEAQVNQYLDCKLYDLDNDIDSILTFRKYEFKYRHWYTSAKDAIENIPNLYFMAKTSDVGADGSYMSLFTSRPETLEPEQLGAIVRNYFTMAMSDEDGEFSESPDKKWETKLIGDSVIIEALNGLTNIQGFINYKQTSYEELTKDGAGRFKLMWMGVIEDFMSGLYKVGGVVGIQNAYQSPVLGTVVSYARAFMFFIIIVLLIGLVFKFMRQSYDLLQAALIGVVATMMCWLFVSVIPVHLPTVFNGALDLLTAHHSSDLGYITLMMHMEDYETTYGEGANNPDASISNTASINLYKYNKKQLQEISDVTGMSIEYILKGEPIIIDNTAGIYIEGDTLKCSLDKLFFNNPITGTYKAIGAGKYYFLESKKEASSCFDYYSPYHLVVDALVEKLNGFNMVFPSTREAINYGKLNKDSFSMRNYITSIPFLQPEEADNLITEQYDPDIADACVKYLGDYNDPFGLNELFKNRITDKAKDSLWYKTLETNDRLSDEQLDKIIEKTNLNTKQFLIDNYDKFQYMSDENIIKMTAMYETISLTRQFGIFNNELYPMFINIEEFDLGDILTSAYVGDRSKFRYKDLNIADYMVDEFGVIWGTVFAVSASVSYLILNIVMYEIPILYILLGVLLAIKFIMQWESKKLIHGYIRGTILLFVGYFIHCVGLTIISNAKISPFTILIPLIINSTILEMLIRYTLTLFKNPFDLGGSISFAKIAPWIANVTGFTGLCAGIGATVGTALNIGGSISRAGFEKGKDQYANYRDINAYDEYAGQTAVLGKVMNEQAKRRNRTYDITSNMNNRSADAYSEYREDNGGN